jgi:osmotically-inducible protein OsmY
MPRIAARLLREIRRRMFDDHSALPRRHGGASWPARTFSTGPGIFRGERGPELRRTHQSEHSPWHGFWHPVVLEEAMTLDALTKNDLRVRNAVLLKLEHDAVIEASAIGVTARAGIVTLTGFVDSYSAKLAAERAATRVQGVKAVANDLQVRLRLQRTDAEIAEDAVRALERYEALPVGVHVVVRNGHVTLTGAVRTPYERASARKALRYVRAIKSVTNRLRIVPTPWASELREEPANMLRGISADGLEVTIMDGRVTLTGVLRSALERDSAERAARALPGITDVINDIIVAPPKAAAGASPRETPVRFDDESPNETVQDSAPRR